MASPSIDRIPPGRQVNDPGIASAFERPLERLMNKDGSFRVNRVGRLAGLSAGFVSLATMPMTRLLATFIAAYLSMNLLFGSVYMAIGVEHLGNADLSTLGSRWMSALGMSIQTLTTVGYGSLYPVSASTWLVAAVEGVFGIIGFSMVAAVIFARFAKPTTKLAFSPQALLAPFKDGWSLQIRVANRRDTLLVEVEARLLLALAADDGDQERLRYFTLPLQIDKISFLPLSWTIVHPVNGESPLAGMSHDDLARRRAELLLILKGVDEAYMQPVIARHSFRYDEIVWGGRFVRAYGVEDGEARLYLSKIGDFQTEPAPERLP